MNKEKTDSVLLILGFIGFAVVVFYIFYGLNPDYFGSIFSEDIFYKNKLTHEVPVEKEKIFSIMADVKNYPKIFPSRYNSVKILNETNSIIFTEEVIKYSNIERKLIVKHTLFENEKHLIEVVGGDAKDTIITLNYKVKGNISIIEVGYEIHLNNIRIEPGFLPKNGVEAEIRSILDTFSNAVK